MKKRFKIIGGIVVLGAIVIMAASCKKDNLSENAMNVIPGVERHITTSATLPQCGDKAFLDANDNYSVKWESGDGLNINGTTLTTTNNDTTKAKFEGTVYANPSGGNEHYWAVYPASLSGSYSGGIPADFASTTSLTVHLPATQTINTANSALRGNTYMAAHLSVTAGTQHIAFEMRNIASILELDLTPYCSNITRVDSIVFTSSNTSLAGTFTVSDDPTNPTVTPTSGTNKVVVTFQDGANNYIDITGGKKVHVILPPLASKNLNMKIYSNAKYMEKKATSITLARNNYYSSPISFELPYVVPDVVGFSVAANKRVLFSPGNLQWSATNGGGSTTTHAVAGGGTAAGTWRFAVNQWDYVGNATDGNVYGVGGNSATKCNNKNISSSYKGWIDLFGWGTSGWNSGATAYQPYSTIQSNSNYYPGGAYTNNLTGTYAYADWGVYNAIYNPKTGTTDPAGTWRTLTGDEWIYLFTSRYIIVNCNTEKLYGLANVNGVNGVVILPDNWNPASCPTFVYDCGIFNNNIFNESTTPKWSQMEAHGCVFLPAAGYRYGTSEVAKTADHCLYWTSSCYDESHSRSVHFDNNGNCNPWNTERRYGGRSVRLVKEVH